MTVAAGRQTMQAAVLAAPGRVELAEVARPEPAAGEVRVRLEGCGVCASNLSPWAGQPWFEYPFAPGAPGHEGWGRVDAIGAGVLGVSVGDRVAMLSRHAYAEYDVAPEEQVVPLPRALDGVPLPGEPLGCAINVMRRSRIRDGATVAVVGVGFLGALLVRLAADAGARVLALSRRGFALDIARAMGADQVVPLDDHWRAIEQVERLTGGELCEVVIESAGHQWPLDLAGALTRERGTLVIAGYHQDGPRQVDMQLWNWRGLDVVNAHERDPAVYRRGMQEAIAAVADGRLDLAPLLTHSLPLERLGAALDATRDRPDGFLKAVVTT